MLTSRQKELVKATVPVLREHGVALISHFYKRMLTGNPELQTSLTTRTRRAATSSRHWRAPFWPTLKTLKTRRCF